MAFEISKQAYSGKIGITALGAASAAVKLGGEESYPFHLFEGNMTEVPRIAMEIWDYDPSGEWPAAAIEPFSEAVSSPDIWAKKCVEELGAELICLKFDGIHPDYGDKDAGHAVQTTKNVLQAVGVPLILWGCGNDEKDNQVMPKVSEAAKGENCLRDS